MSSPSTSSTSAPASTPAPAMEEPVIAQKGPYKVQLLAGYRYAWCACGLSKWQPFCDGSHTGSKAGLKPKVWTNDKDQTAWLCGCKRSAKFPFCDGTHNKL
jgi:CDGSH iron-sulfur domain-containing protein 3